MNKTFTLETIQQVVQQVWDYGRTYNVWAFHGDMGSGKTTFIHALCDLLQVNGAVSSPTYAIINEYESASAGTIYHMDWYRLNSIEEALQAGVEEALFSNQLCLVEWPEKAAQLLPANALHLHLDVRSSTERTIVIDQPV